MSHREIDRLVAEKVMGWRLKEMSAGSYWVGEHDGLEGDWELKQLWKPSKRIQDTWIVVEKLRGTRKFTLHDAWNEHDNYIYSASFDYDDGQHIISYQAYGETASLAICLAALKTVGVEVKQ